MLPLEPKIIGSISQMLADRQYLQQVKSQAYGPLHILFPEMMNKNVLDLRTTLEQCGFDFRIFFAHKPTKSRAFLAQALRLGLGIDAASREELCNALAVGFTGTQIECTGVKNDTFLQLALQHGCLIVVDSLGELDRIVRIKKILGIKEKPAVLVRMSNVEIPGRKLNSRPSRFGIAAEDFSAILQFFQSCEHLTLKGFHLHNDEREADIRAGQLQGLLHLIMDAYRFGLSPTVINIGGGLRREQLTDKNQWSHFITNLEESLVCGKNSLGWRGFAYGMRLNDQGKVAGRGQAIGMFSAPDFSVALPDLFNSGDIDGQTCGEFIRDNDLTLLLEPGQALLDQCGMSVFEVIECKRGSYGNEFVVVDGNMYNLSASMREYAMDPILLCRQESTPASSFEGFIVGNLCREEDFLMRRKVFFNRTPCPGDLIVFVNTAAYHADFENAAPHQHPVGTKMIAGKQQHGWKLCTEETYDAFNICEEADIVQELARVGSI